MRRFLLVCLLVLSLSPVCQAKQGKIPAGRAHAAEELIQALNVQKAITDSTNLMIKLQVQQNPQMAQFEDVLHAFFAKYMSWQKLKPEYIRLYAEAFTESELKEITAFYRTKTGQKVAQLTPVLMQKGAMLGQQIVLQHQGELQAMIQQRLRGKGR